MKAQFPTEQAESGEFQRQEDVFREWITIDGSTPYAAAKDRYHLYVSLACPWASRTVIFRKLKGLEGAIGMRKAGRFAIPRAKFSRVRHSNQPIPPMASSF